MTACLIAKVLGKVQACLITRVPASFIARVLGKVQVEEVTIVLITPFSLVFPVIPPMLQISSHLPLAATVQWHNPILN